MRGLRAPATSVVLLRPSLLQWLAARRRFLGDAEQRLCSHVLLQPRGPDRSGDRSSFAAHSPI